MSTDKAESIEDSIDDSIRDDDSDYYNSDYEDTSHISKLIFEVVSKTFV